MSNLKIKHGPFAGNEFEVNEAYTAINDDGTLRQQVLLATATQRFLEKFPPHEGWSVQVAGELLPLEMVPLTGPVPEDGYRVNAQHVPAAKFVATLTNPSGVVVGSASTLWTISGPTAWERGETNARTRLYEAMGLQIRFGEALPAPESRRQAATVTALPTPDVRPVVVKPIEEEPGKAHAATAPTTGEATQAPVQAPMPEPAPVGAPGHVVPAVQAQPTPDAPPVVVKPIEQEPVQTRAASAPTTGGTTQPPVQAPLPDPAPVGAPGHVMPAVHAQPEATAEAPQQQGMELGDGD